ncbi:MAG TPA: sugar ABC transporter permease [Fimbriimonadaceae bacterium]|nr:sugar ABC transporter permease [Fimbriimonadaceae bacterium]
MRGRGRTAFILAFLAPACTVYAALVVWPLIQAVLFSGYRWRGVSRIRTYVGLDNYQTLWRDDAFWTALKNNLFLLLFAGMAIVALALLVAHGVRGAGRLPRFLRSIYLFPQVVSVVVVAVLWQFILNPQGLLNAGLAKVGIEGRAWLGDPSWALPAVGIAFVWYAVGFYIMLFAAGLEGIPSEIHEAAELDGSRSWHRFKTVTWPLLWSVKRVAVTYLAITVMNTFALVYLMTRGGPDRRSEVMLTYLYENAFVNSQFGYATALAVGNFVVVMTLSLAILWAFRRNPTEARG